MIRAPVTGLILEREVEKWRIRHHELRRGARRQRLCRVAGRSQRSRGGTGYQPERFRETRTVSRKRIVTTDAYPDRKYEGVIDEISPEANRQKATVQVKVKVTNPDDYLRPEMNANVAFIDDSKPEAVHCQCQAGGRMSSIGAFVTDAVFVMADGKAVKRTVKTGHDLPQGLRIEEGLFGGEDADP